MKRPKTRKTTGSDESVAGATGPDHQPGLLLLAGEIDWDGIDDEIAPLYNQNRWPGIEVRFMTGCGG
jgi:hypothetical protein